ncbi:MAG: hypothetical protein IJH39_07640 [Clostridia bacterium]|nr:hypothetical protein [Clostridia bacterium]
MEEISILRDKINEIIQKAPNKDEVEEFVTIEEELHRLQGNSIAIRKNNFFARLINSVRTRLFSYKKEEFDEEKYLQIKDKAIKLYNNKILKNQYPIMIESERNEIDAFFGGALYGNRINEKLLVQISKYASYYTRLEEKEDGKIEIYPFSVKSKDLGKKADAEYLKVSENFLTTKDTVEESFKKRISYLTNKNKAIKDVFMQKNINLYFGSPQFICERSNYILECMNKVLDEKKENKGETEKLIEQAKSIVEEINRSTTKLNNDNNKSEYDKLKQNFEKLLLIEGVMSKDVEKMWKDFLTDPKDFEEGKRFAFLVHAFTGKIVNGSDLNKCCCTLVTDKCMPIPYSNVGIVCDFSMNNISNMCCEDAGSWLVSKKEFFEREIPIGWQFAEDAGDGINKVWYEEPKVSKLITPKEMEKEMIENNINVNQNVRNGKKYRAYTEIFMVKGTNGENIPVQEMFYTDKKGKKVIDALKNNHNPIMLDPSKGTEVSFDDKENDKDIVFVK